MSFKNKEKDKTNINIKYPIPILPKPPHVLEQNFSFPAEITTEPALNFKETTIDLTDDDPSEIIRVCIY